MNILVLTQIDPEIALKSYQEISRELSDINDKLDVFSLQYDASYYSKVHNNSYFKQMFVIMNAFKTIGTRTNKEHVIFVGNCYRSEKFDMVVVMCHDEDSSFDFHIERLKKWNSKMKS